MWYKTQNHLERNELVRLLIIGGLSLWLVNAAVAQTPLESCEDIPALAADVMTSRQVSYDIMLMLNRFTDVYADRTDLLSWAQAMIDMAYAQPIAADRVRQVEEFKALWSERCANNIK